MESPEQRLETPGRNPRVESRAALLDLTLALPVLTREQEQCFFRQMNYLKFLAEQTRRQLSPNINQPSKVKQIDNWLQRSATIRHLLVEYNLKLVVDIGAKYSRPLIADRLSAGTVGLIKAIDAFDYRRGIKLSTYATMSIHWAFRGERRTENRERRVVVNDSVARDQRAAVATREPTEQERADLRICIDRALQTLSPRQREILVKLYGLDGQRPKTQEEVSRDLGVSRATIGNSLQAARKQLSGVIAASDVGLD